MPTNKSLDQILKDVQELERILGDAGFRLHLEAQASKQGYEGNKVAEIVFRSAIVYGRVRKEEIEAERLALIEPRTMDLIGRIKREAGIVYCDPSSRSTTFIIESQNMKLSETDLKKYALETKELVGYYHLTVAEQVASYERAMRNTPLEPQFIDDDDPKLEIRIEEKRARRMEIIYRHQDEILLSGLVINGPESPASYLKVIDDWNINNSFWSRDNSLYWLLVLSPELCQDVVEFIRQYPAKSSHLFSALFPEKNPHDSQMPEMITLIDTSNAPIDNNTGFLRINDGKVEVRYCG